VLVFQLGNSYADSPKLVTDIECVGTGENAVWHVRTYEVKNSPPYSKLVKDVATQKKCGDDIQNVETTIECRSDTWHVVTYKIYDSIAAGKAPEEVSAVDTGEPCGDIEEGAIHLTGAVGKVYLVTQVCVGEDPNAVWHVITLDFTNPAKPVKVSDINTGQSCSKTEVDPPYETVFEMKCLNDYWYIQTYRVFPDGLKQSIGNLIPTNEKCYPPPHIPNQKLVQVGMIDNQNPPSNANQGLIPDWVKTNIGWWGAGLISDRDIAGNLGFLTQQGILQVENVEIDLEGSVVVSENPNLPNWLGNNARWLASGEISDKDFLSGVQFLFNEDVISFKEKPTRPTITPSQPSNIPSLDPKIAQLAFETAKQNEVSMTYLQKIKAAEYDLVQNSYDISVNTYSENQDQTSMNNMIGLGHFEKISKELSLSSTQFLKTSVTLAKEAKDDAIRAGVNVLDLEAATVDQQHELDSMSRHFKTESEINSAYKNALKSQRLANTGLQNVLTSSIQQNPNYASLSSSDKNFVSTTIGGIEYSDFKIPSSGNGIDSVIPDLQPFHPFSDSGDSDSSSSGHSLSETLDTLDAFGGEENNQFMDLDTTDFLRHFYEEYGHQLDESHRETLEDLIDGADDYYPLHFDDPDYDDDPTIPLPVFSDENEYDDALMRFLDYLYENFGDHYFDDFWFDERVNTPGVDWWETPQTEKVLNPDLIRGYEILNGPQNPLDDAWNDIIRNSLPDSLPNIGFPDDESDDEDAEGFSNWLDDDIDSVIPELGGYIGEESGSGTYEDSTTNNPDGSVTTKYPDGWTVTKHKDGTTTRINPEGDTTYTEHPDGSQTTTFTSDDGTTYTEHPDGTKTTKRPDGSVTTTYPGAPTITTYPDGRTVEPHPGGGETTTYPGGKTITTNPDGPTVTIFPDGTKTTVYDDGWTITTNPDGTSTETTSDGTTSTSNPDGSSTHIFPDGTTVTVYDDGTVITDNPDGSGKTEYPDGTTITDNPDGTTTTTVTESDGTVTTTYPDGTEVSEYDDGTVITTYPDGSGKTEWPNGTTLIDHPDGSSTTINPDGTVIERDADGNIISDSFNQEEEYICGAGYRVKDNVCVTEDEYICGYSAHLRDNECVSDTPTEKIKVTNADGTETITYPDGTSVWLIHSGQSAIITYPDGSTEKSAIGFTMTGKVQVKIGTSTWNFSTHAEAYAAMEGIVDEHIAGNTTVSGPYDPNDIYLLAVVTADYGRQYPAYQLDIVQYSSTCNGERHYLPNGALYSATTLSLGHHSPVGNCGYGTVSNYPIQAIYVSGDVLNTYLNHVGLDSFPPLPEDTTGSSSGSSDPEPPSDSGLN
jgi:hypothetical protein